MLSAPDLAGELDALETRHLSLYASAAGETLPLGPGAAVYAGPGLPVNRAVGLGRSSEDAAFLPAVEAFFGARGAAAQVE